MLNHRALIAQLALLLVPGLVPAQVFNTFEHADGDREPVLTYEEDRTVSGHEDRDETLSFRLSLWGEAGQDLPLLVQVHEWGGSFQRQEEIAAYTPHEYDFVMLSFQYKPSSGNQDDWWFGTRWNGECRMWAHEAVMQIVREAISSSLVPDRLGGVTVDRNRVYLFGHSIGGTGAWQLGVRNPDVFAAVHAHSGLARFTPPVGPFELQFEHDIVGSAAEAVYITARDGQPYPARDFSDLSWWLTSFREPSWELPFIAITAASNDDTVPPSSGGDLMLPVLDSGKHGFFYHRHDWGHSGDCFVQLNWLGRFRLDQSFLAFTNRSGYGAGPGELGDINDLQSFSWDPDSIVDLPRHYQVRLVGSGTADVTLRRLQAFVVSPSAAYTYWLDQLTGAGSPVTADEHGLLTIPAVSGGHLLIIEPAAADQVVVGSVAELVAAVAAANGGGPRTILLEDGTYTLDETLWVSAGGVTVRSLSGNRSAVVLQGQGMQGGVSHIFEVEGAHFTARDMTLRSVANHAIQIHGEDDADSPVLANLHILDTYEQMLKVSYDPASAVGSDSGLVEGCRFEYSAGIGPQYYIGGVDAHQADGWIVRDNTFIGIRSPSEEVAEHAIHFWSDSSNTLVERNLIVNCDRGIGFGMGDRGHQGGIIRNNMVYHDSSELFADVGIVLESATDVMVYNNTVFQEHGYANAIEYRFGATTGVLIANNLTNRAIARRDGASANVTHNNLGADRIWFADPTVGDLHLATPIVTVVDQGMVISGLVDDFDGDTRPQGSGMDIGADEYTTTALPPTAAFSWTPVSPVVGETVRFADHSTGAPDSWLWSFGDGTTSTLDSPSHAFAAAATYTVSLTASNSSGSNVHSERITVRQASTAPPVTDAGTHVYLIPAAAKNAGEEGTNWLTDVVLNNMNDSAVTAHLYFLEREQDNSNAAGASVQVPATASLRLDDVLATVFGLQETSGAILVGSDQPLLVTSRTYNDQGVAGTFGQFIQGFPLDQAVTEGGLARLVQLTHNARFRTNIGLVNASNATITVAVTLYRGDGTVMGSENPTLAPFEYFQYGSVYDRHTTAPVDDGFAILGSDSPGARFFAYASVIDQRNGDAICSPAFALATK